MKTFLLLLAFFSSCYIFAQPAERQGDLFANMQNDEKIQIESKMNQKDTIQSKGGVAFANIIQIEDEQIEDEDKELVFDPDSSVVVPESWETNFDNLLNSWYITNHTKKLNHEGYQTNVQVSGAVYAERLSKLPTIIKMPYNETIGKYIDLYVDRRRKLVEYMLGLEAFYYPMIEETFDKYGLPLELKNLVIIESAMNPIALSRVGASGLWQFMIGTGKIYGLEVNSLVDDRRDPIKSTDAAARHLKDLYVTFGDWHLAIAAYNCGSGNVNKAIKRSGGKKDFWTIFPYLPRETRSYVPLFIAANYVMNYYAYHQLYPVQTTLPLSTDTVMVNQMIHFDQIAEVLKIDKEMIRALNPQYKFDIIPGDYKPQILKLPTIQLYAYIEKESEIVAYRADELLLNRVYDSNGNVSGSRTKQITHTVARGETIVTIARKYGLSASTIRRWNYLGTNNVPVGKKITLYVDLGVSANSASTRSTSSSASPPKSNINPSSIPTVQYKVQPGDSFYIIAQKFPGYSSADLMRLNNRTSSALQAGQYILVPKM